jgi:uroporphyrinogen-III synthase
MRVVVTRPAQDAARWALALRERGCQPLELPLIAIEPVADPSPLQAAWRQLDRCAAAMFVSANAVERFHEARGSCTWPADTRAWAPGPGTAAALERAGVPPDQVDAPAADAAQFDSEALWDRVQPQARPGTRVLIVRGADAQGRPAGRDWMADRLRAQGAQVEIVAAYRRRPPDWTASQREQARAAATDGSVWLLSSSEAVGHLRQLVPGVDWSHARAIATHERIARAARDAGFGVVCPSRPDLDAVIAALESFR